MKVKEGKAVIANGVHYSGGDIIPELEVKKLKPEQIARFKKFDVIEVEEKDESTEIDFKDLEKLSKANLVKFCNDNEIKIDESKTKNEILEFLAKDFDTKIEDK